jgi:serine phosphatase RsbU (regulator of sigma subunit)
VNARFHRDALVRERVNADLSLAREVARSFLPAQVPVIAGYEFYACNESASEVGGDYYDFIPLKDGRLGILVGDVAGKGVAAALVMARFSAEARACVRTGADLASAIRQLNELMQPLNLTDRFVTLVALLLDPQTHTLTLVNAGHPSPLLRRRATGALEEAIPGDVIGPPIGVLDDFPYEAHQVALEPGDDLILFSDGVTDAMDMHEDPLGTDRLRVAFQAGGCSPDKMGEGVLQAVKKHAAGQSQHDDITLVCLGRLA